MSVAVAPLTETRESVGAWLYVLDCDHGVKVGITTLGIDSRLGDFERGYGCRPIVFRAWPVESAGLARQAERCAHALLAKDRTSGEWFHCHPVAAVAAVERALRAPGFHLLLEVRA